MGLPDPLREVLEGRFLRTQSDRKEERGRLVQEGFPEEHPRPQVLRDLQVRYEDGFPVIQMQWPESWSHQRGFCRLLGREWEWTEGVPTTFLITPKSVLFPDVPVLRVVDSLGLVTICLLSRPLLGL